MSSFLTLNSRDLLKGVVLAVIAAVISWLYTSLNQPGFQLSDFLTLDWMEVVKVSLTAILAYLGKNLMSDENGRVLGKI